MSCQKFIINGIDFSFNCIEGRCIIGHSFRSFAQIFKLVIILVNGLLQCLILAHYIVPGLRIKIENDTANPTFITTVWGFGYKWGA